MDKYKSRENRAKVRDLFMREWDPIGVKDEPAASDEYDDYAAKAYVMLMQENSGAAEIADYLYRVASDRMGLSSASKEASSQVAAKLAALKPEFES